MPEEVRRDFGLTMSELIDHSNAVQMFMVRDTVQFATFGILSVEIQAFRTDIDEIEVLPQDDEMRILETAAAESKNAVRAELENMLRAIEQRARLAFGETDPKFQLFRIPTMSRESDGNFLIKSRRIKRYCVVYLTELTAYGMTQLMIDALEDKNDEFELALDGLAQAISNRDTATNNRNVKSNAVYEKLMRYCTTGKAIWFNVNEAFYNDYLTYSLPPGVPLKIQDLAFNAATNTISWSAEVSATSYELVFSLDTPTPLWVQLYLGPNTSFVHVYGPSTILYKCRGINANGNGYWSNVLTVTRP